MSLSPNLISYSPRRSDCDATTMREVLTLTDTVSFSFTMGTTPIDSSSLNVLTAFRYLVRCAGSARKAVETFHKTYV